MKTSAPTKRQEIHNVGKRVNETKREIEKLKQDLQKLITKGLEYSEDNKLEIHNDITKLEEINLHSEHEIRPDLTSQYAFRNNVDIHSKVLKSKQPSPNKNNTKSQKNYNVEEAREYIRQQRQKRLELHKNKNVQGISSDAKKQKLQDLHHRALQLVAKNVQQRQKKVKPVNKESYVRLDKLSENTSSSRRSSLKRSGDHFAVSLTNSPRQIKINKLTTKKPPSVENSDNIVPLLTSQDQNESVAIREINTNSDKSSFSVEKRKEMVSKDVQTENKIESIYSQLQPIVVSHPYNFINTVQRKFHLTFDAERNRRVDASVQCFPAKLSSDKKEKEGKTPSQTKISLNLDAVKDLNLLSDRLRQPVDKKYSDSTSELDTSRNVPDLSNEAIHALIDLKTRKAAPICNKDNNLNVDIIKDIVLQDPQSSYSIKKVQDKHVIEAPSEIDTTSNKSVNISTEQISYSNDFESSTAHECNVQNITMVIQKTIDTNLKGNTVDYTQHINRVANDDNVLKSSDISCDSTIMENLHSLSTISKPVDIVSEEESNLENEVSLRSMNGSISMNFESDVCLFSDRIVKQVLTVSKSVKRPQVKPKISDKQITHLHNSSLKKLDNMNVSSNVNYSRGSDISNDINDLLVETTGLSDSAVKTDYDISQFNSSVVSTVSTSKESSHYVYNDENINQNPCAGLSLKMLEHLIRDEDGRLENLRSMIKIRERALLDRTKGELTWLEFQRKQLIETGKTEEASLVKKKQRGILLKHEQERNEMKKLRLAQKAASQERRAMLKQHRNLIKLHLSSKSVSSRFRVTNSREFRHAGPLRVLQLDKVNEKDFKTTSEYTLIKADEHDVKKVLLSKEIELQKRRKAAEVLLEWHKKLMAEEKKIIELEDAALNIVAQTSQKFKTDDQQLNRSMLKLQFSKSHVLENKSNSLISVDVHTPVQHFRNIDSSNIVQIDENITNKYSPVGSQESVLNVEDQYTSDFGTVEKDGDEENHLHSLSNIINDFSKIEDEISDLSRVSQKITDNIEVNLISDTEEQKSDLKTEVSLELKTNDDSVSSSNAALKFSHQKESFFNTLNKENNKILQVQTTNSDSNDITIASDTTAEKNNDSYSPSFCEESGSVSDPLTVNDTRIIEASSVSENTVNKHEVLTTILKNIDNDENSSNGSESIEESTEQESNSNSLPVVTDFLIDQNSCDNANGKEEIIETVPNTDSSTINEKSQTDKSKIHPEIHDVGSLFSQSTSESSDGDSNVLMSNDIFGEEVELLKQQLAIEQEIKELEQAQQDDLNYVFMREIPNKPPPPYTPPSALSPVDTSVVPATEKEIYTITNYSSNLLFKSYQEGTLNTVCLSFNDLKTSPVTIDKNCAEFLFNICKELTIDYYKPYGQSKLPSWLIAKNNSNGHTDKSLSTECLEQFLTEKLFDLFKFKEVPMKESAIMKWSRKKRDNVDDILMREAQKEEPQWSNFDEDELLVKDRLTNDIMKTLIRETAVLFQNILKK